MSVAMTCFMHFRMSVKQAIFIQALMTPITLFESPVLQHLLLGGGGDRPYGEKLPGESLGEGAAEGTGEGAVSAKGEPAKAAAKAAARSPKSDADLKRKIEVRAQFADSQA